MIRAVASAVVLGLAAGPSFAQAPSKAEVIHWWTSGGESAALRVYADAYARANTQTPGTRVYARPVGYGAVDASPQSCAAYPDPAAAQAAFLAQGGPAVDPLGLDPDGDGFVCGWDPARYRSAAN